MMTGQAEHFGQCLIPLAFAVSVMILIMIFLEITSLLSSHNTVGAVFSDSGTLHH